MHTPDELEPQTMSVPMEEEEQPLSADEWVESPVDDETYDILMALASKLEAIDTYRVYADDGNARLWQELAQDERHHAERLFNELKRRLAGA